MARIRPRVEVRRKNINGFREEIVLIQDDAYLLEIASILAVARDGFQPVFAFASHRGRYNANPIAGFYGRHFGAEKEWQGAVSNRFALHLFGQDSLNQLFFADVEFKDAPSVAYPVLANLVGTLINVLRLVTVLERRGILPKCFYLEQSFVRLDVLNDAGAISRRHFRVLGAEDRIVFPALKGAFERDDLVAIDFPKLQNVIRPFLISLIERIPTRRLRSHRLYRQHHGAGGSSITGTRFGSASPGLAKGFIARSAANGNGTGFTSSHGKNEPWPLDRRGRLTLGRRRRAPFGRPQS